MTAVVVSGGASSSVSFGVVGGGCDVRSSSEVPGRVMSDELLVRSVGPPVSGKRRWRDINVDLFSFSNMGNILSAQVRLQKNLEHAAIKGDLDDVKHCVSQGADPQLSSVEGWNAVHHACLNGHAHVVEHCVTACRASVHTVNVDRATPLMLAVTSQSADLVAFLLRSGALPNERQKEGLTALHLAAIMRLPAVITLLRAHGASDAVLDDQRRRPSDLVAPDDDFSRAAFRADVSAAAAAADADYASATEGDDDDDDGDAATVVATVTRENIEALCTQLHATFARVKDVAAIDEMIAFYTTELHLLKHRRRQLTRARKPAPAAAADDDDDDDADSDDKKRDIEMLPLIDT